MKQEAHEVFAENLRKWRAHKAWSLRELAEKVGVSHVHLANLERDGDPRLSHAQAIAKALSVPLEALTEPGGFERYVKTVAA